MASNEIALVNSIHALTSQELNRNEIVRDKSILQSLILFLGSSNNEVVDIALKSIQNLSESTSNCKRLEKEFGMMASLQQVITNNNRQEVVMYAKAIRALDQTGARSINGGSANISQFTNQKSTALSGSAGNTSQPQPGRLIRSPSQPSNHSFFNANARKARTVTLQLVTPASLSYGDLTDQLNNILLSTRGVVSFTFDHDAQRITLRLLQDVLVDNVIQQLVDVRIYVPKDVNLTQSIEDTKRASETGRNSDKDRTTEWGGEIILKQVVRSVTGEELLLDTVRSRVSYKSGEEGDKNKAGRRYGNDNDDDEESEEEEEEDDDPYALAREPEYLDEADAYSDTDNTRAVVDIGRSKPAVTNEKNSQGWLSSIGSVFRSIW